MTQAFAPLPRERHVLGGRSRPIDPRIDAVRRDLADVRLADRVFAPHYAAPLPRTITARAALLEDRDAASLELGSLAPGDMFEVLDVTGGFAWGIVSATKLVGYVDARALGMAE